jgi:hypothetical protein
MNPVDQHEEVVKVKKSEEEELLWENLLNKTQVE